MQAPVRCEGNVLCDGYGIPKRCEQNSGGRTWRLRDTVKSVAAIFRVGANDREVVFSENLSCERRERD